MYSMQQNRHNHAKLQQESPAVADKPARRLRKVCTFLPARRYATAGLCDSDVSVRPSVCLSVCLSVCHTPVLCLAERKQDREMYTVW